MLVTLSELKTYLSIGDTSQDTLLTLLLSSAESSVLSYTGREFEADTSDRVEIVNGNAQMELCVQKYPIISLIKVDFNAGDTSIAEWQEVANTGYSIESKIGLINFLCPIQRGLVKYRITYRGGYATVPGDIKLATLKIASANFNRRTSDGIKGETVNGDRIDFETSEIPDDVKSILNNYRRPYV